jgi:hypothetical protein
MSISVINKSNKAQSVRFVEDKIGILLEDGRELSIPLEWFPNLRDATLEQLNNWRLIGGGEGIHWIDLDEDISIDLLF